MGQRDRSSDLFLWDRGTGPLTHFLIFFPDRGDYSGFCRETSAPLCWFHNPTIDHSGTRFTSLHPLYDFWDLAKVYSGHPQVFWIPLSPGHSRSDIFSGTSQVHIIPPRLLLEHAITPRRNSLVALISAEPGPKSKERPATPAPNSKKSGTKDLPTCPIF